MIYVDEVGAVVHIDYHTLRRRLEHPSGGNALYLENGNLNVPLNNLLSGKKNGGVTFEFWYFWGEGTTDTRDKTLVEFLGTLDTPSEIVKLRVMSDPYVVHALRIEAEFSSRYKRCLRTEAGIFPRDRWFHVAIRFGSWRGLVPGGGNPKTSSIVENEPEVSVFIDAKYKPYTILKQRKVVRAGIMVSDVSLGITALRGIYFWNEDGSRQFEPSVQLARTQLIAEGDMTSRSERFELWDIDPTQDLVVLCEIRGKNGRHGISAPHNITVRSLLESPKTELTRHRGVYVINGSSNQSLIRLVVSPKGVRSALNESELGSIFLSVEVEDTTASTDGINEPIWPKLSLKVSISSGILISLNGTFEINDDEDEHLTEFEVSTHAISSSVPGSHTAQIGDIKINPDRMSKPSGVSDAQRISDRKWRSQNGPRFSESRNDVDFLSEGDEIGAPAYIEAGPFGLSHDSSLTACSWVRLDQANRSTGNL